MVAVTESGKGCLSHGHARNGVRKDMKLKFNKKNDIIRFHVRSDKSWSKPSGRARVGRKVSERELRDRNRIEQIRYEEVRSMTRGLALEKICWEPQSRKCQGVN